MRCRCLCEIPLEQVTRTRCLYGLVAAAAAAEEEVAASPSTLAAPASEVRLRLRVCLVNEAGGMAIGRLAWSVRTGEADDT